MKLPRIPKESRKRAISNAGDEVFDSTHDSNSVDSKCVQQHSAAKGVMKSTADLEESRVETRRYGKTPKVLKISKASASGPLPHFPDDISDLLKEKFRGGKDTATHVRLCATKGNVVNDTKHAFNANGLTHCYGTLRCAGQKVACVGSAHGADRCCTARKFAGRVEA